MAAARSPALPSTAAAREPSAGQDLDGQALRAVARIMPAGVTLPAVEDRDQAHGRGTLPSVALDNPGTL